MPHIRDIVPPEQLDQLRRLGTDLRNARLESAKMNRDDTPYISIRDN